MKYLLLGLCLWTQPIWAQSGLPVYRDLIYKQVDTTRLHLDIYLPDSSHRLHPVIVWIHGGGWREGSKRNPRPNETLLKQDYAIVSVQYRFSQEAIFPAQLLDCKDAIRFIRQNAARYDIDPDRIGVWGNSAGGQLAALLGTTADHPEFSRQCQIQGVSDRVQAVVDECGPTDFTHVVKELRRISPDEDNTAPTSVWYQLLGGTAKQKPKLARKAGALTYVTADDAPFLIMHGLADNTVPVSQSIRLHKALRRRNVPAELHLIPNRKHDIRKVEVIGWITAFLSRTL